MKRIIDIPIETYNSVVIRSEYSRIDVIAIHAALVNSIPYENVTDFADRCRECGERYGKMLKQEPCLDMEEIREVMSCDADAETKCKMISNILSTKPHYFEKQEPCEDTISRQAALDAIKELPPVTLQKEHRHCKDCKWWKDSDGVYRRGVGAESICPINNVSVNHGIGYCYMFEPQESEG